MPQSPVRLLQPASAPHARDVACLTSLRFFAAAWVVALHYSEQMPVHSSTYTAFFENGRLGVDFFFVLSGFILTHVYLGQLRDGRFSFRSFIARRFARLYPLHLATLLVVIGYVAIGRALDISFKNAEAYTLEMLWHNLLMIHAWGFSHSLSWNYVSWSISAEWFAYLVFLPLALLFIRLPGGHVGRLGLALATFTLLYLAAPSMFGHRLTLLTYDFGALRILPEFMLGVALYHLSVDWDLDRRSGPWLLAAALAALLVVAHFDLGHYPAVLLLALLIFGAASLERQGALSLLCNRALVYLGETSYALYMTHAIVFILYFKAMGLMLGESYEAWVWYLGPVALLAAFVAASLAYHLVEHPARAWLTARSGHRRAAAAALAS
jgi:peptidoglycan/LPS O-acetylase OafA/YrhL